MIVSPRNARIRLVRSLLSRPRKRRQTGAFLAEGVRLIEEALSADWPFRFVLYSNALSARGRELLERLKARGVEVEGVESRLLQSLSETETSQGILAVLDERPLPLPSSADFVLIPDSIRDPGNLGTLLRSAEAAGVQAVLIPPETSDPFAPKVLRAGMGAHFRLPIHILDWKEIRRRTLNLRVLLADMEGRPCWETNLRPPLALIVGGEAEGATPEAYRLATAFVSIPMAGKAESLNAAVAGSILLFEVLRQRSYS